MDLLFKRYASPFLIIDTMILTCSFSDFIMKVYDLNENDKLWQFYLHKVYNKSFDDFKNSLDSQQSKAFTKSDIETTVNKSYEILQSFVPEGR